MKGEIAGLFLFLTRSPPSFSRLGLQSHALCLNPANVEACVEAGEIAQQQANTILQQAAAAAAAATAAEVLESRKRGKSDPVSGLAPFNPGKDCNGNCNPCPPNQAWQASGDEHGSTTGTHWHGIFWNQDKSTCMCYPTRVSGKDQQDLH